MAPSSAGTSNRASAPRPPRRRAGDLLALLPAAGLAALSLAFGTLPGAVPLAGVELPGGASAAGAVAVHALVLAAALFAAPGWRRPLELGRRGRWLTVAVWAAAAVSAAASPVPRAGRVAVVLLPAWLLVPSAVARCWPGPRERRRGLTAVAAVVLTVALAALGDRLLAGSPRAAMPLGHHNLLAVWLVALLPAAALPARAPGAARWIAAAAVAAAGAALAATGSLAGAVGATAALGAAAAAAAARRRGGGGEPEDGAGGAPGGPLALAAGEPAGPAGEDGPGGVAGPARGGEPTAAGRRGGSGRRGAPAARAAPALAAAGALLVLALAVLPRLAAVVAGDDPSLAVRATYYAAGWRGLLARPLLGWGPGAAPWTIGEWIEPLPGVNPPHEVVGDLHSLPLQLAYELGFVGLAAVAAAAALFAWRRLVALPVAADRGAALAGLLGLLGAGIALLASAPLAVAAVPAALATAAGLALAGESPEPPPGRARSRAGLPVWVYVTTAAVLLLPLDRAHLAHDRAVAAGTPAAERAAAARAVALDPAFPLYRARLARGAVERAAAGRTRDGGAASAVPARELLAAAEGAWGVGALWLAAGEAALAAGEPWAAIALERACRLDPLGAEAPFLLALADPASPAAPRRAARALAAEPRLAAALAWRRLPELRAAALAELAGWEGIDPGWRLALAEAAAIAPPGAAGAPGGVARLVLLADREAAGALSLHAFRRRPRPLPLADVRLDAAAARRLALPSAAELPTTSRDVFTAAGCGPGG